MSLPEGQVIQGLYAAEAANLQFDNIRDFEIQICQAASDGELTEPPELLRNKLRAVRLFNQYVEMGGMFFGRDVAGAENDPVLSGDALQRTD